MELESELTVKEWEFELNCEKGIDPSPGADVGGDPKKYEGFFIQKYHLRYGHFKIVNSHDLSYRQDGLHCSPMHYTTQYSVFSIFQSQLKITKNITKDMVISK